MKITRQQINEFTSCKRLAVAGVSRDPKKFGYQVFTELRKRGYEVIPVNRAGGGIEGISMTGSVKEVPADVKHLLVVTSKNETMGVVREAVDKGFTHLWLQQMSYNKDVLEYLSDKPVRTVSGECIMMWTDPVKGVHKFHKTIKKVFGALPG
jgi:predicted CoA-binding protein